MRARSALAAWALALTGFGALPGCALFRAADDIESVGQMAVIAGVLETPQASRNPLIVGLVRDERGIKSLVSYYVRRGGGPFRFQMPHGSYHVFAFEDANENLRYDQGEPVYYAGARQAPIAAAAGTGTDLGRLGLTMAAPDGLDELRAVAQRDIVSSAELQRVHRGTLASLADPRFSQEVATEGMWAPYAAFKKYGAGTYFLEPYDPARVPVVFVHGVNGSAREFTAIIDSLDRSRFQPWVFQYPSGLRLETVSQFLFENLEELQLRHQPRRFAIVAHSMGGLVSRNTVNKFVRRGGEQAIALYVTIATPWDGNEEAAMGTRLAPVALPVWFDLSPNSPFLEDLFRTPLPDSLPYYLFYGYRGGSGTDGAVTLLSLLKLPAQEAARRVIALPEDHNSILGNAELIVRLNALLAKHAAPPRRR